MSVDRNKLKAEATGCLGQNKPAGELADCVAAHFPDVQVFRENDDLVIKGGQRFLVVRRDGAGPFSRDRERLGAVDHRGRRGRRPLAHARSTHR